MLLSSINLIGQKSKVMSFNIRYDNKWDKENSWDLRKDNIIKLINNYEPSILGTQEGLFNQVSYIDSSLSDYKYIGIGREDGVAAGEYCAIFYKTTKYKIISHSTFWLSETPDLISVGWDAALERICTYGLFEDLKTKKRIYIFNAHFDHQGKLAQKQSAKLILKKIKEINTKNLPIVLMGDLNVTPEESPIEIIEDQLSDALKISEKPLYGPTGTFNGFKNEACIKRIDYAFTKKIKILSYSHIDDRLNNNKQISDHYPVLMTMELLNENTVDSLK